MMARFRLIVRDDKDARAHGHKCVRCIPGYAFPVEEEIDKGDHGREEDAGDLVEGDGGVGEGEVLEDDVEAHCCCEG